MDTKWYSKSRAQAARVGTVIGFLLLILDAGVVHAETLDEPWTISVPVYLAAGSHYYNNSNETGTVNSLSIYAEAVLSHKVRPYSVGLFVDYSHASEGSQDGMVNAGALVEYEATSWDWNAYLFVSKTPDEPGLLLSAERVRYKFADNHKIGVEVVGPLRDPSTSALMIGYYASLSPSVSFNFAAGAALNSGRNRKVRIALIWQIG